MTDPVALDGLFVEGVDVLGMAVRCSGCGGKFHQLTRKFRNEPPMRGTYLKMIARYRSWGWHAFPELDWVVGDNVQCPQCGTPYRVAAIMKQIRAFISKSGGMKDESQVVDHGLGEEVSSEQAVAEPGGDLGATQGAGDDENELVGVVVGDGVDDRGLDSSGYGGVDDVQLKVMKMTVGGSTQAEIAQTCGLSVYMVRQIQNGRKV